MNSVHRGNRIVGVSAAIVCSGASIGGTASVMEAQIAHPSAWSQPAIIPGISPLSMRWPSVAGKGETVFVAANVFPTEGGAVGPRPLVIARIPGSGLPLPPGNMTFAYPKIAVGASGRLHMVWAEFDSIVLTAETWNQSPKSIWYSSWSHGRWSPPEQILRANTIYWRGNGNPLFIDRFDAVHVVVPASTISGTPTLHYATRQPHRTTWTDLDLKLQSVGASITGFGRDSMGIAFVGPDTTAPGTHGSVFVTRSVDGGASWTPPILIDRTTTGLSENPRIAPSGSSLVVIWSKTGATSPASADLRMARSNNGGAEWGPAVVAALSGRPLRFSAAVLSCDRSYAAVELRAGESMRLEEVTFVATHAQVRDLFSANVVSADHALAAVGSRLVLAFDEIRKAGEPVRSVVATRPAC